MPSLTAPKSRRLRLRDVERTSPRLYNRALRRQYLRTVNTVQKEGGMQLWKACRNGDALYVKATIDHYPHLIFVDQNGRSPLYLAATNSHMPCVQLLLRAGAMDPDGSIYANTKSSDIQNLLRQYEMVDTTMNHNHNNMSDTSSMTPKVNNLSEYHGAADVDDDDDSDQDNDIQELSSDDDESDASENDESDASEEDGHGSIEYTLQQSQSNEELRTQRRVFGVWGGRPFQPLKKYVRTAPTSQHDTKGTAPQAGSDTKRTTPQASNTSKPTATTKGTALQDSSDTKRTTPQASNTSKPTATSTEKVAQKPPVSEPDMSHDEASDAGPDDELQSVTPECFLCAPTTVEVDQKAANKTSEPNEPLVTSTKEASDPNHDEAPGDELSSVDDDNTYTPPECFLCASTSNEAFDTVPFQTVADRALQRLDEDDNDFPSDEDDNNINNDEDDNNINNEQVQWHEGDDNSISGEEVPLDVYEQATSIENQELTLESYQQQVLRFTRNRVAFDIQQQLRKEPPLEIDNESNNVSYNESFDESFLDARTAQAFTPVVVYDTPFEIDGESKDVRYNESFDESSIDARTAQAFTPVVVYDTSSEIDSGSKDVRYNESFGDSYHKARMDENLYKANHVTTIAAVVDDNNKATTVTSSHKTKAVTNDSVLDDDSYKTNTVTVNSDAVGTDDDDASYYTIDSENSSKCSESGSKYTYATVSESEDEELEAAFQRQTTRCCGLVVYTY